MHNKKYLLGYIFLFILFATSLIPTVTANPIEVQETLSRQGADYITSGLVINAISQSHAKTNTNLTFYMSAYGLDGKLKTKDDIECLFGYATPQGAVVTILYEENMSFVYDDKIWIITMDASTLIEEGDYVWNFNCEEAVRGGYLNGHFFLSEDGIALDESISMLMLGLIGILVLFLFLSLYSLFSIEHYIGKFIFYWVSHVLVILITFSAWQVGGEALLNGTALVGIFKVLFYVFTIAVLPMVFGSMAWILYIHAFNEHFQKLIDKGEDPETALAMTKNRRKRW